MNEYDALLATGRKWWRSIDPTTVDPLTLVPIKDFSAEPFTLGKALFDAETLAHYLVSTAAFVHPTTRENINRDDCMRLDEHLRLIGAKTNKTKVTQAYDILQSVGGSQAKREQSEAMRREATVLFQHLFTFRSRRSEVEQQRQLSAERVSSTSSTRSSGSDRRQPNQTRRGDAKAMPRRAGGMTIVDDDDDIFSATSLGRAGDLDLTNDFPELYPVATPSGDNVGSTRLVKPRPRGGALASALPSRNEASALLDSLELINSDDEENDVPTYDSMASVHQEDVEEQTHSNSICEETQETEKECSETRTENSEMTSEQDEEILRVQAEAQIRMLMQNQHATTKRKKSVRVKGPPPPPPPPPKPIIRAHPAVPSITQKHLDSGGNPTVSVVKRKFINPKTLRGPCITSLLITLMVVLLSFIVLFWIYPLE